MIIMIDSSVLHIMLHQRLVGFTAFTVFAVLLEAVARGHDPILHSSCEKFEYAKHSAEEFCRVHMGNDIASCTEDLANAVWRRCSSWLNSKTVSLPVKIEADPSTTCAMNVFVDGVEHCILMQEQAAALLPNEIPVIAASHCARLNLDSKIQCPLLESRLANISLKELARNIERQEAKSSAGNADGTLPFLVPAADKLLMGQLRNWQSKLQHGQSHSECTSLALTIASPSSNNQETFAGIDVLRYSNFRIETGSCELDLDKSVFCFSIARHQDVTSSGKGLDLGCIPSSIHKNVLLGNANYGPHIIKMSMYKVGHVTQLLGSTSSVINVVARRRTVNRTSCPYCTRISNPYAKSPAKAPHETSVTLLTLVNRGRLALSHALASWKVKGLLDFVDERIAFLQNYVEGFPDERAELLRSYNFKVIGRPKQQGIALGLSIGVQKSSSSNILFLEEDFSASSKIDNHTVIENVRSALALLNEKEADVVRLRSMKVPGTPNCANVWQNHARELLGHSATSWVNNISTLDGGSVVKEAHERPEGLWNCGNSTAICAYSTHASWTNNPIMFRRSFFLQEIAQIAAVDSTKTLEAAVSFTPAVWGCRCHTIAQSVPGCFTHDDRDKDQWQQTVCPDLQSIPPARY